MSSDTVMTTWRIEHACRLIGRLISKNPIAPDAIPDAEAVQAWAFVTSLYNGIEQALKHLLLLSDLGLSRERLKRSPYRHDLESLYSKVEHADRRHIAAHFREHRSLHNYDSNRRFSDKLDEFISHINLASGGDGEGLVNWRYVLLDGVGAVPQTHLWSMWETWDGICCTIRHREYDKVDDCSRLSRRLLAMFEAPLIGIRDPYPRLVNDLKEWNSKSRNDRFTRWIDLLIESDKCTAPASTEANGFHSVLLELAASALRRMDAKGEDPDQVQLVQRIRHAEHRLSWHPRDGTFK